MTLPRILEILKTHELTVEEFNHLTQEEKDALCNMPAYYSRRNFIPLGNMVYIRQGHTISYLEGFKYEVRDQEVHALAEIELDGGTFVYGIPLRGPITAQAIKQFIYENDISFRLKAIGASIKSYQVETRIPHSFDASNSTESYLPHYLKEVKDTSAFDCELLPTEASPLIVPNTIRLDWKREDLYEDKQSSHTWVDIGYGDSLSDTGTASQRNSSKYNLLDSHMNLFLDRYFDVFHVHTIDGRLFRGVGGCSKRMSNLISRWRI